MTVQTLTLDQCPPDIRAFFLSDPGYQSAVRVTKSSPLSTDTPAHVTKSLKTSRVQHVQKAANLPGFAAILAGSVGRDIRTPAPAIPKTPAPTTTPTDAVLARANAGGAGITRQASNTPKAPIPSKGEPVSFQDLRSAIDTALAERHQREQAERFNAGRSAFSHIAPTKKSDVQGGGSGDAWSLRNLGGRLAASVLNSTTRKNEGQPVGSSALDIAFGRGR
jgi:hypothetical protein